MRAPASGVVILLTLGTAACGLGGSSGASCPGPRQFYLSKSRVQGNQVLTACAAGFHMASRFEVASLSGVVYDAKRGANATLSVDLEAQEIRGPDGGIISFEIDPFRKQCLLLGLDDVGLTLQKVSNIEAFEAKASAERPWL